ncbi:MAG: autotransporter domain-containing protein, partial [Verrucomicrobia bacterium]|nr:autotransporter domain-containing protein [Verrucomicrobiota bacterium]
PGDFIWNTGGTLSMGGALTGLEALGGTNRTLEITEGGTWDTTASDLLITGTGNTLSITNGGRVDSASAFIGVSSNDWGNTVLVDGDGSEWILTEDLFINPSNTLSLASTGLVSVAGNMVVSNATVAGSGRVELGGASSMLSIYGTNSQISADVLFDGSGGAVAFTDSELVVSGSLTNRFINFDRLSLTNSLLAGTGTMDVFTNINMFGGWVAPVGELVIDGAFEATNTTLRVTAGADRLHVAGALNLSGLLAEVSITNATVTSTFSEKILEADGGLTGSFAETNFIEHFLLYDFALTDDGTNVLVESEAAADGEISASLTYAGIQGIRAGFNGMQNAAFVRTKQLRRNSVATDHAISHEAYLMQNADAPTGPQGPGDQNTIFGMHFWAEQFSGQGDYDSMGNSDGFSLNNNGTTFGFDKLIGDSLVAGINYTYARSDASVTGGDRSDTETYWLGLYAEWFAKSDYYLEGLLALGWSDYETVRTDMGYRGEGSFGGNDFGGHIEGGKYFHRNNWALAPYAGLNYLGIKSDAYTETDPGGGPPVEVDGQSVASLESALGVKLRNRFDTTAGRFQTVGYAEWAYDFINDDMGSTLSDGTVTVGTARIAPGASVVNAGIGFSWICTDYLEVGLGYDGRFNENYEEHTGSIMFDVRF